MNKGRWKIGNMAEEERLKGEWKHPGSHWNSSMVYGVSYPPQVEGSFSGSMRSPNLLNIDPHSFCPSSHSVETREAGMILVAFLACWRVQ
jgi:hypothetical protein